MKIENEILKEFKTEKLENGNILVKTPFQLLDGGLVDVIIENDTKKIKIFNEDILAIDDGDIISYFEEKQKEYPRIFIENCLYFFIETNSENFSKDFFYFLNFLIRFDFEVNQKKKEEWWKKIWKEQKMKKFCKSKNKIFSGVCGGIGEYFNIDPTFIRLFFVLGIIKFNLFFLAYIILAIITPDYNE